MRRCRPLMSSGTRAVSVVLVGITHHGWQSDNCKNAHTRILVIPTEARNLGHLVKVLFRSLTKRRYNRLSQSASLPLGFVAGHLGFGLWCSSIPAMAHVKIETIKNGPYIVTGEVELIDSDGNRFPEEKRMALCRCGASTGNPFCDGTHSKIGFKAAEKAGPESKE